MFTSHTIIKEDGTLGEVRAGATIYYLEDGQWKQCVFIDVAVQKAFGCGVYLWNVKHDENTITLGSNQFCSGPLSCMLNIDNIYTHCFVCHCTICKSISNSNILCCLYAHIVILIHLYSTYSIYLYI
jgi:hypothetical protein